MTQFRSIAAAATLVLLLTVVANAQQGAGRESTSGVSAGSIRQWIEDLDSDSFAVREAATRELIDAGTQAIAPVSEAATGGNLEVSCRAFHILIKLSEGGSQQTEQAAMSALEQIARSPHGAAGRRAASLLRWWKTARQQQVLAQVRNLGGTISTQSAGAIMVRIGSNWKGGEAGLAHLRKLPNLQSLSLENSSLGDAALAELKSLAQLDRLYLGESQIKGAGLSHLKGLSSVTYLSLKDLKIGDNALKHVAEMTQLEYLDLDGTLVTDAALPQLKKLTGLKQLWLDWCI